MRVEQYERTHDGVCGLGVGCVHAYDSSTGKTLCGLIPKWSDVYNGVARQYNCMNCQRVSQSLYLRIIGAR